MTFLRLNKLPGLTLIAGILLVVLGTLWTPEYAAAQGPGEDGVTVLLVIDDSRSMRGADPDQRRGLGGRLLIERLFPGDEIGVVLFSRQARVVQPISDVGDGQDRDHLKNSFLMLQSSGATDMLDALSQAYSELERHATDNSKLVIFLTDGQLIASEAGSPKYQAAWRDLLRSYRAKEWPVFPVSFGREVDTQFLKNVAEVTGGETCDAPSDSVLVSCFQRVLDSFKETEAALEIPPGCLEAGETAEHPVYVDPYARQFSVVLERQSPAPEVSVLGPTGDPVGTPREEGSFLFYSFSSPAGGTWVVRLAGPGCSARSFGYIHSDVTIDLESPAVVHAAQHPMDIRAIVRGRRPQGNGAWESLTGDLALSVTRPDGRNSAVHLSSESGREHLGRFTGTGPLGDYRLNFRATVELRDPETGEPAQRTYLRQERVEVVEAPVLEVTLEGEDVRRVLPGDAVEVRGRIAPPGIAGSPGLKAALGDGAADLYFAPDGSFTGTITPASPGRHSLEVSYETTLTGVYGQVRYSTASAAKIGVEFERPSFHLVREAPGEKVIRGRPVSLTGRFRQGDVPVNVDQPGLRVQLVSPQGDTVQVKLEAGDGPGVYRGSFVPEQSGSYTLGGMETALTRNGVPFTPETTEEALEVLLKPLLEVDTGAVSLGEVYPGAVVTRQLRVSNNSDREISLDAGTNSRDISVDLSPILVPAGSEMQPVRARFRVHSGASAGGGGTPAGLFLEPSPSPDGEIGLVIPVSYEVGDFFVALEDGDYDLGYVRPDGGHVPVQLELAYNSPVPVTVAIIRDSEDGALEVLLPAGRGDETVALTLPLPDGRGPGTYQSPVRLVTDPPVPVRPPGEVTVSYRVPSGLESWVLANGWWTLVAGGGVAAGGLLVWGGMISRRVTLQGRLLIYDRWGLTPARREELRWFKRPEVTIGCGSDVTLQDPSGVIDREHARIGASRDIPYPRVYPVGLSRVIGPYGEEVDADGAPLGSGDTFSIGHYNLEWSPSWAGSLIGRVLGDPWWRLGLALAVAAVVGAGVAFYLIVL